MPQLPVSPSFPPSLAPRLRFAITLFALVIAQAVTLTSFGAYEVPNSAGYAPPAAYYSGATGTGATLRMNLHNAISTMTDISYGDDRYAFSSVDADPSTPGNILLIYTQQSISGAWGSGSNYSREHQLPVSWLGTSDPGNTYVGIESDLFELRPINQTVNSNRGNEAYGPRTSNGVDGQTTNGMWYPGDWDAGEVARAMFYMATRYYDGTATPSITNLKMIAGQPASGSFEIGDLPSLLSANYTYGVDNFERARNETIYSGWNNSNTGAFQQQGNRNPFIDHPEYVWAIFGSGANDSQISVATPDANGKSTLAVNLGRVITNSAFGTSAVTVNKTGADPTTFNLTAAGNATTVANGTNLMAGPGQPMNYGAQAPVMTVGLNASTSTAGIKSGTLTIKDTDLTSAAAGDGSADGDDVVNVTGTVVDHSDASFSSTTETKTLSLSLGTVTKGTGVHTTGFSIANLLSASGYTAALNLTSVTVSGNGTSLYSNVTTFTNEAAGTAGGFLAELDSSTVGSFSTTYTLAVSDENIPGATAGQSLVLSLDGTVTAAPEPGMVWMLGIAGGMLLLHRPRRSTAALGPTLCL